MWAHFNNQISYNNLTAQDQIRRSEAMLKITAYDDSKHKGKWRNGDMQFYIDTAC